MEPLVHAFDWPDRLVVGTVGQPESRTFYLQARSGRRLLSIALEKEQSALLAERMDEMLDELMAHDGNPFSIPALTPEGLVDNDSLEQPVEEQFRAGALGLGWEPATAQIVIEAFPLPDAIPDGDEPVEIEPEEVLVVRIPVGSARAFAKRTREVVGAGRPICPLCSVPMDGDDHACELPDGFR